MSALKSNNRFEFLNEEPNPEPIKISIDVSFRERDTYYDDKPRYNQFKSFDSKHVVVKKDFEIKEDEFPDLVSAVKKDAYNTNNLKTFSSLLKKEEISNEAKEKDKLEEDIIPPGWTYYKYKKINNGLCDNSYSKIIYKVEKPFIEKNSDIIKPKVKLSESEEIIKALSILHEKRTNEYKESWGEAEWERTFICPNYDYEYFDKLDEAYEEEQAKLAELAEQYYNNNDSEDYDNY
jgi:hypothetical protein